MYWRDLSPHARELVLRMVLTQSPANFRHVEDNNQGAWQMSFVIDDEVAVTNRGSGSASPRGEPMDPHSDLALAMRLGCRFVRSFACLFVCLFWDCFVGVSILVFVRGRGLGVWFLVWFCLCYAVGCVGE